jgi:hypothetical protein
MHFQKVWTSLVVFWCVLGHVAVSGRSRPPAVERAVPMEVCPNDKVSACKLAVVVQV